MEPFKIQTVTAFVATDDDGVEGVMGAKLGQVYYPMICADTERVASMFPIAEGIARATGIKYRILEFLVRVDVTEEITKKYRQ